MKVLEKAARMGPKYPLCKMQMQTNRSLQFLLYIPVAKKSTFVRGCGGVVDKALMDFRSKGWWFNAQPHIVALHPGSV